VHPAPWHRSTKYWLIVPPVSVEAVQLKLICTAPEAVAPRFVGAVGVAVAPIPLNAAICITQPPALVSGAVALYVPVAVTIRSSARSESGFVMILTVYPVPAPLFPVNTVFAPNSKSFAFVVATAVPLFAGLLLPVPPTVTSSGFAVSNPLYSKIRMSGMFADGVNFTVTVFPPATAAAMFFA
jgi:hypothetical protein